MDYSVCVCMNPIELCCSYNPSHWIVVYPTFYLVISFSSCVPFQVACYHKLLRGALFSPFVCYSLSCTFLDLLQGHTLASNKEILLSFACNHSEGDTVLPTAGTSSPNSLRSSWDFLSGRYLDMLVGQTCQHFWC